MSTYSDARHALKFRGVPRTPTRAHLVNEDMDPERQDSVEELPRSLAFFINPDSLQFGASSSWARLAVPGLSHEVLQWSHSQSSELSFQLWWSLLELDRRNQHRSPQSQLVEGDQGVRATDPLAYGQVYRDFLLALTIPLERGRAPSRVSVVWPGTLMMVGAVTSVKFGFTKFARNGTLMSFSADVQMVESRLSFRQRRGAFHLFEDPAYADDVLPYATDTNASPRLGRPGT
jgi:hypothetical protein